MKDMAAVNAIILLLYKNGGGNVTVSIQSCLKELYKQLCKDYSLGHFNMSFKAYVIKKQRRCMIYPRSKNKEIKIACLSSRRSICDKHRGDLCIGYEYAFYNFYIVILYFCSSL